jgi:hypothetical protein
MPVHGTILLDSGAFLQEMDPVHAPKAETGYFYVPKLEVGYFNSGDGVSDMQVFADGRPFDVGEIKLRGLIEIKHTGASQSSSGAKVSIPFADSLLKIKDLYQAGGPKFKKDEFDCTLVFKSGRVCGSLIKPRAFKAYNSSDLDAKLADPTAPDPLPQGLPIPLPRSIPHNFVVHYKLEDGDTLEFVDSNNDTVFSSSQLPSGTERFEIELIADNSTCHSFFHKALDLTNHPTCYLPNQGDPPPMGIP